MSFQNSKKNRLRVHLWVRFTKLSSKVLEKLFVLKFSTNGSKNKSQETLDVFN